MQGREGSGQVPSLLAERAASKGPRWTRARWENARPLSPTRREMELQRGNGNILSFWN